MQARGISTCFGLLDVVFESPVLGVGVRHIHRHILEPSLGLLFVHRVRERGALLADRCRNSLRSPLLTGPLSLWNIHRLLRFFLNYSYILNFKRTLLFRFVKLDFLFHPAGDQTYKRLF